MSESFTGCKLAYIFNGDLLVYKRDDFAHMREAGETCSVHCIARIVRENKLKAQIGYKRRHIKSGKYATMKIFELRLVYTNNFAAPPQKTA